MAVLFRLLGDVDAQVDGTSLALGPSLRRTVFAVLAVKVDQVVPVDVLIDRVWGTGAPPRAHSSLYSYVTRLRATLAGSGADIVRRGNGYLLAADEMSIDLHRFRDLVRQARDEDDARAAKFYEEASALWQGDPFAGLESSWLAEQRAALEQERHAAFLDSVDVRIRLGRHAEVVAELSDAGAEHPLDERLAAQAVLALHRGGQRADALRRYREISDRLRDELGVDPGEALRSLHHRVLTEDPELTAHPVPAARVVVPRQLPPAPRHFVGRADELRALSAALLPDEAEGTPIALVSGTGGLGKTSLALRWAHRNAHRFPDGQVFLDLRGFSPTDERLPPQVALLSLLSALGVAPGDVPSQPDAQIGLYRSLVADRGLLLVLDNAGDVGQVTPLLPGGSSAAVLITSRDNLNGLAATHGATSVTVPSLSRAESRELIATRLGPERLAAEPAAVDALTSLLGGLPLALSILATRAREHARFSLESLVCELRDETARLAALDVGGAVSVRAVFSWSSAALPPDLVRVFGLLGLAPQADLSLAAAASLVGLGTGEARAALSALERASLVEEHQPGRYRMHDLVKLYAFERAADLPVAERDAALPRLTDFYLHSACAAQKPLDPTDPTRPWITIDPPEPGCVPLGFTTPKEALDWFRAEAACLVTAQHEAVARGWHGVVWRLAWAQTAYYQQVGHPHLLHELWTVGLASARALGDGEVLLLALRRLGNASRRIGGFADAVELLEESVALATVVGSPFDQVLCLLTFAECLQTVGDSQGALDQCDRAEAINRTLDDPSLTLRVLASVAWYAAGCEQYERAEEAARTAVTLVVPGDFHAMTAILDTLGHIACRTGRLDQAADHYDEALAIAVENDDEYSIGDTAENVGWVYAMRDDLDRTTSRWNQAVHSYVVQQRAADAARVLGLLERLRQAESPAALVAERDTAAHP